MKSIALTLALLGAFAVAAIADNKVTVTTNEEIAEVDVKTEEGSKPEEMPAKK